MQPLGLKKVNYFQGKVDYVKKKKCCVNWWEQRIPKSNKKAFRQNSKKISDIYINQFK